MVGGRIWSRSAKTLMPASNPPAPPSICPVMDFVDLMGTCLARSPKTRLSDRLPITSPGIPGGAWGGRGVVAGREGLHGGKSPNAHRRDGCFRAAADHHLRRAALDNFEGIADRMRRGGTRRGGSGIRSARAVAN